MNSTYFDFEFDAPQCYIEPIKSNRSCFDNENDDAWFDKQHPELDADDTYEYEKLKSQKPQPLKYQQTQMAKYEYLKNVKRSTSKKIDTTKQDNSIFYDYTNHVQNGASKRVRQKSIAVLKLQTIQSYREMIQGLMDQRLVFNNMVQSASKQQQPRKSIRPEVVPEIDEEIQQLVQKLLNLGDIEFLESLRLIESKSDY